LLAAPCNARAGMVEPVHVGSGVERERDRRQRLIEGDGAALERPAQAAASIKGVVSSAVGIRGSAPAARSARIASASA